MAENSDVQKVIKNTTEILKRRIVATEILCLYYAGLALKNFRTDQDENSFWTDRTRTAHNTVFSNAIKEPDEFGFFLAHAVEYGIYLELANDRKHEALRPTVENLFPAFQKDLKRIWE